MYDVNTFDNITCITCGGNEFHTEAGFYYCNECQTQSQEIREQVFDVFGGTGVTVTRLKKTKIKKSQKSKLLTSWEGYNIILSGLVNEMIELGVKNEFKTVVYNLWAKYLYNSELLPQSKSKKPKLGALHKAKDAAIVYDFRATKGIKKKDDCSSLDDLTIMRREFLRQKRSIIRSDYETTTVSTSDQLSIHSKSLGSLSSNDSGESPKMLVYSRRARKAMLKVMSNAHLGKHVLDVERKMKCHKYARCMPGEYLTDPDYLTRVRLYSLLYIGLMLIESDIQLSDMLRFCREGRLSFLSYNHFFPEYFTKKQIDETMYMCGLRNLPDHRKIRKPILRIMKHLKLNVKWFGPDLNMLVDKYCKELNLPDEIKTMAQHLIAVTKPKMLLSKKSTQIPNFEGRAMAFIIYTLKYLFGLDGMTEFEFTKFAKDLNDADRTDDAEHKQMFVWDDWVNFIHYRNVLLKNRYFPIWHQLEPHNAPQPHLFLQFLRQMHVSSKEKRSQIKNVLKKLLGDLQEFQDDDTGEGVCFEPTLTPFHSYLQKVKEQENLSLDVLKDFSGHSVDFLITPGVYLKRLNGAKYVIKEFSANQNGRLILMHTTKMPEEADVAVAEAWYEHFRMLKIDDLSLDLLSAEAVGHKRYPDKPRTRVSRAPPPPPPLRKFKMGRNGRGRFCKLSDPDKRDHDDFKPMKRRKWFISSWTPNEQLHCHRFNKSALYTKYGERDLADVVQAKLDRLQLYEQALRDASPTYNVHHMPQLDTWLNVMNLDRMCHANWEQYRLGLPSTFSWLLDECAPLIEQKPIDLFHEFMCVEMYINFVYLNNAPTKLDNHRDNCQMLHKFISRVKKQW